MKYNEEQQKALKVYRDAREKLSDAIVMVEYLKMVTAEEADLREWRAKAQNARKKCKELGVYIV